MAKVKKPAAASAGGKSAPLISEGKLQQLYTTMLRCRALGKRARLFYGRSKSAPIAHFAAGEEAIATGCAIDLRERDTLASAQGDFIGEFVKGAPLSSLFSQLAASSSQPSGLHQRRLSRVLSLTEQPGIVTGIALANQKKRNRHVVVALVDAALESHWHEAFRLAGVKKLPILFVLRNHVATNLTGPAPRKKVEPVPFATERHGFPVIPVDGNDVVAIYRVTHEALKRARLGGGPTLMDCKSYRLPGPAKTGKGAIQDPIRQMEQYLTAKGLFSKSWKNEVLRDFSRELDSACAPFSLKN